MVYNGEHLMLKELSMPIDAVKEIRDTIMTYIMRDWLTDATTDINRVADTAVREYVVEYGNGLSVEDEEPQDMAEDEDNKGNDGFSI